MCGPPINQIEEGVVVDPRDLPRGETPSSVFEERSPHFTPSEEGEARESARSHFFEG